MPHTQATSKSIPDSDASRENRAKSKKILRRVIQISIACIIIPPLFGLAVTVFTMVMVFEEIGQNGMGRPEELAVYFSVFVQATAGGLFVSFCVSIVALPVLIVALVLRSNLSKSSHG